MQSRCARRRAARPSRSARQHRPGPRRYNGGFPHRGVRALFHHFWLRDDTKAASHVILPSEPGARRDVHLWDTLQTADARERH